MLVLLLPVCRRFREVEREEDWERECSDEIGASCFSCSSCRVIEKGWGAARGCPEWERERASGWAVSISWVTLSRERRRRWEGGEVEVEERLEDVDDGVTAVVEEEEEDEDKGEVVDPSVSASYSQSSSPSSKRAARNCPVDRRRSGPLPPPSTEQVHLQSQ